MINRTITSTHHNVKDYLMKLAQEQGNKSRYWYYIYGGNDEGTLTNQANKGIIWDADENTFALLDVILKMEQLVGILLLTLMNRWNYLLLIFLSIQGSNITLESLKTLY